MSFKHAITSYDIYLFHCMSSSFFVRFALFCFAAFVRLSRALAFSFTVRLDFINNAQICTIVNNCHSERLIHSLAIVWFSVLVHRLCYAARHIQFSYNTSWNSFVSKVSKSTKVLLQKPKKKEKKFKMKYFHSYNFAHAYIHNQPASDALNFYCFFKTFVVIMYKTKCCRSKLKLILHGAMRKIETKFTKRQLLLHATLVHYNVNDYYLIVGLLNELRILSQSGWNRWRQCLNSMISHLSTRCATVFHKISFILLEDDDKNTVIRKNNWLQRRASNGIVHISHRFGMSKCKTNILNGLFNALNIDGEIQLHTNGCNLINTWQNARHRDIGTSLRRQLLSNASFNLMLSVWRTF